MFITAADIAATDNSELLNVIFRREDGEKSWENPKITARINEHIKSAESKILGYVAGRYTLPFDPVPDLITEIAKELTVYEIYKEKRRESMSESMQRNYRDQLALLKDIQCGKIALPVETAGEVSAQPRRHYRVSAPPRIFTDDVIGSM